MVRIVFGPSVAISVVVSAQLATVSARAPKASNNKVIDPNPRTSLLIPLPAHERRSHAPCARAPALRRPLVTSDSDRGVEQAQPLGRVRSPRRLNVLVCPRANEGRVLSKPHRSR